MKTNRFTGWLQAVFQTQDEEISCSECFDSISCYVELALSGEDPAVKMPQVSQHLNQCPACREEFITLYDLRRLEDEGGSLSLDDLIT
jgi:hypothetical protein